MEALTLKQRLIVELISLIFNATPLIIGFWIGEITHMLINFGVFVAINVLLDKFKLKNHAPGIYKIPALAMCYFVSNLLLLLCLLIVRFGNLHVEAWQITLASVIIVTISTLSLSNVFYGKSNENIETKQNLRKMLKGKTPEDAMNWLKSKMPEHEAICLYWLDYVAESQKGIEWVAFNKLDCSASKVKEIRRSAYYRLRCINPDLEIPATPDEEGEVS